jgi:hypothetical protein
VIGHRPHHRRPANPGRGPPAAGRVGVLADPPHTSAWARCARPALPDGRRSASLAPAPCGEHAVGLGCHLGLSPDRRRVGRPVGSLIIHQSQPDRSRDDPTLCRAADTHRLTCDDVARREGFEPPTARSVVCRESSAWWSVVRRCCSRPQNLVLPVRLVCCGPPVVLSYSVKKSVNNGLRAR